VPEEQGVAAAEVAEIRDRMRKMEGDIASVKALLEQLVAS
jgi:hypothetical protein